MANKDRLAEVVAGMTEAQAGPFLNIAQAYLLAARDAEEKGRTDISNEMIKYLRTAVPQTAPPPQAMIRSGGSDTKSTAEWTDGTRDTAARSSTTWTGLYQTQNGGTVTPQPAAPAAAYPAPQQQPVPQPVPQPAPQPVPAQSAYTK